MRYSVLAVLLLAGGVPVADAQDHAIGAVAALVGQGTIRHAATTERAAAKLGDDVFVRDRIETADQSVMRVLLGGRITVTIRERSIVTITDDPMRPRVDLETGKLTFKVHQGGLRAGEVGEILTPNSVTAIRGSLVVAEVNGHDSDVTVLQAHKPITIAPRDHPTQVTQVPIGHTVRVSGLRHAARIGPIRRATRERLLHVANMAEVPGRPRDGGEERSFRPAPALETRPARGEARRAAVERAEPRADPRRPAEWRRRQSRGERDEAVAQHAERVEPPLLPRRYGAR